MPTTAVGRCACCGYRVAVRAHAVVFQNRHLACFCLASKYLAFILSSFCVYFTVAMRFGGGGVDLSHPLGYE